MVVFLLLALPLEFLAVCLSPLKQFDADTFDREVLH